MSRIIAVENISLDGVMQAPGRPDEDQRGGFRHGGWAVPYNDDVMAQTMGKSMSGTGALLLGRRTYEDFYGFWPKQTDNPYTEILNNTTKYVASTTLADPLPWQNSVLLSGDVAVEVTKLKEQPAKDIVVLGSGSLLRTLIGADLVDEYTLLVHPILLGSGWRLFPSDLSFPAQGMELVDNVVTTTGAVIATYQRMGNDDG